MRNDCAKFGETLREFRDGLEDKDQRMLFNKLLGGAGAGLEAAHTVKRRQSAKSEKVHALVNKLVGFRNGLPPQQREALTATILASGAAWARTGARDATDGERPEDGEGVSYMLGEFLYELGKALAEVIMHELGAGDVVDDIRGLIDPDVDVPDVDHPT